MNLGWSCKNLGCSYGLAIILVGLARILDGLARILDGLARILDALARILDALARILMVLLESWMLLQEPCTCTTRLARKCKNLAILPWKTVRKTEVSCKKLARAAQFLHSDLAGFPCARFVQDSARPSDHSTFLHNLARKWPFLFQVLQESSGDSCKIRALSFKTGLHPTGNETRFDKNKLSNCPLIESRFAAMEITRDY